MISCYKSTVERERILGGKSEIELLRTRVQLLESIVMDILKRMERENGKRI